MTFLFNSTSFPLLAGLFINLPVMPIPKHPYANRPAFENKIYESPQLQDKKMVMQCGCTNKLEVWLKPYFHLIGFYNTRQESLVTEQKPLAMVSRLRGGDHTSLFHGMPISFRELPL